LDEHVDIVVPGHDETSHRCREHEIFLKENGDEIVEDGPDQADTEETKAK
jgi:hypothetical protein